MPSDKKRLSCYAPMLVLGFMMIFLLVSGCKKKERLTASTFRFAITPPASTLLKTNALTLAASGSSAGGPVEVSPTWTVSPASVGTVTPDVGTTVVFQPAALGDAVVSAVYDGMTATAQIAVVSYIPSATAFNVYSDAGLPSGAGINALLFTGGGLTLNELSSGYTPEGVRYQHATNSGTNSFWGISLDAGSVGNNKDLSAYTLLKFDLRLGRTLSAGEALIVRVEDTAGTFSHTLASGDGDYNRTNLDWQEISIPVSSGFPGLNSAHVTTPFIIVQPFATLLTFDVDAIRWAN